jgi:hypothetical protein
VNRPPSTPLPDREASDLTAAVTVGGPDAAAAAPGRHRQHRFPARPHALKVLYGEDEHAMIRHAAEIAGLRPSSYVAMAALVMAEQVQGERHGERPDAPSGALERRRHAALTPHHDRELLAELIQARLALRRYAVNVNQIAAALNSGGQAPVWLPVAIAGADRAVARLDTAAQALARRLR